MYESHNFWYFSKIHDIFKDMEINEKPVHIKNFNYSNLKKKKRIPIIFILLNRRYKIIN